MAGSQELEDQRRKFAEDVAIGQTNMAPRYSDLSEFPTFQPEKRTLLGKTENGGLLAILLVMAVVVVAEFLGLRDMVMMVVHLIRRWVR